jgi:uncharacterized membrane protein
MKKTKHNQKEKIDESKGFAFIATFLSIIGFVIAIIAKKNDDYVMFYAKQSLVIFIVSAVLSMLAQIFLNFLIIGQIINLAVTIIIMLMWVISWVFALSGIKKEVPLVGKYGRKFNF